LAATLVWDNDLWEELSARFLELTRAVGSLSQLPWALNAYACSLLFAGNLDDAVALSDEDQAVAEATALSRIPFSSVCVAAFRGDEKIGPTELQAAMRNASRGGDGYAMTIGEWADALVSNGLGRYEQAMVAAQHAVDNQDDLGASNWALGELIEAAARCGRPETAVSALNRLSEMAQVAKTSWVLGIEARSRALLSDGAAAEGFHLKALEHLAGSRLRPDLARAHLLYGEWLRRERRRTQAREQLRAALGLFEQMGMEAFAARARRELRATGETARRRPAATGIEQLTAHEAQIARLARDGLTNPEIGARLFLSPRTVQYHLGNVFAKVGISSRSQLDRVLPAERTAG
jgi:DNA-binding CsgD family transcriptional regulator